MISADVEGCDTFASFTFGGTGGVWVAAEAVALRFSEDSPLIVAFFLFFAMASCSQLRQRRLKECCFKIHARFSRVAGGYINYVQRIYSYSDPTKRQGSR